MSVIDRLLNYQLVQSDDELMALVANKVVTFGDLEKAVHKEPSVLGPVLNRYINWFNKTVAPLALKEMGFT